MQLTVWFVSLQTWISTKKMKKTFFSTNREPINQYKNLYFFDDSIFKHKSTDTENLFLILFFFSWLNKNTTLL